MKRRVGGLIVALLLLPAISLAEMSLESVVKQTISSSPKVLESWESFRESMHQQDAAKGGYFPQLDLRARAGHEANKYRDSEETFDPAYATLTLRQLLFDGLGTPNEVGRLGYSSLAKYFEMLQTSEDAALETVKAYADVLQFRELLQYANENYQAHQVIYEQVKERVDSGVGRGVDLEQAKGRLALAQSNQVTEANNLHDVTARFYRISGELPQATLASLPAIKSLSIPSTTAEALLLSLNTNPGFKATMENVRAAEKARDARKSKYLPTLDFLATYDIGSDREELDGHSEESFVGFELSYNLFNGGSDLATVREFSNRMNRAIKLREIACRNLRQTVSIAYTELKMIENQLVSLKQHEESISNARTAYQNQFDIGQRTLLDLLDSENEYFRARRAHTIAEYDYFVAHAETLSNMGQLLTTLGIRQGSEAELGAISVAPDTMDPQQVCPIEEVPEALYRVTSPGHPEEQDKVTAFIEDDSRKMEEPQSYNVEESVPVVAAPLVPAATVADSDTLWVTPKPRRYSEAPIEARTAKTHEAVARH